MKHNPPVLRHIPPVQKPKPVRGSPWKNSPLFYVFSGPDVSDPMTKTTIRSLDWENPNDVYLFHIKDREWYRLDFTPVLIEHVPVRYKAMLLLIT